MSPLIIAQDSFISRVLQGWRARTPMMRGVTFMPSEPPLLWAQEIGSVASIPALAFFRFSEERNQPTAVHSPLAGESDQLHSAPALVPQPALPEVPQVPPLEGETSSGSGEDLGPWHSRGDHFPLCGVILHFACGYCRSPGLRLPGDFSCNFAPDLSFTFLQVTRLQLHFH